MSSQLNNFLLTFIKRRLKNYIISRKFNIFLPGGVIVTSETQLEEKVTINNKCDISGSYIGFGTYIASNSRLIRAKIGKFCSIGQNVQTRFGRHPARKFVSTHPAFFSKNKQAGFSLVQQQKFKDHIFVGSAEEYFVDIGNDVWIGDDVKIMDGVKIGDGAIVGLGSVVTKNIEPYSINAGSPARQIGQRFTEEQKKFLIDFKWWDQDFNWIKDNSEIFDDVEAFIKRFKS